MKRKMLLIGFALSLYFIGYNIGVIMKGLSYILEVFSPFIVGIVLAFTIHLPMNFFERYIIKIQRKYEESNKYSLIASFFMSLLSLALIISLFVYFMIPQVVNSVSVIADSIKDMYPKGEKYVLDLTKKHDWLKIIPNFINDLLNSLGKIIKVYGSTAVSGIWNYSIVFITSVGKGVVNLIISLVFSFYLLFERKTIKRQIKRVVEICFKKEFADKIFHVADLTYTTFCSFVTGQCLDAIILAAMFAISMSILQLPYALLISTLIGFTALIPIIGAFIGCIVGAILIFIVSPIKTLIFLILFILLQQIEENVIYPRVVGKSVGLPPIWVFVAVALGGKLLGIAGMILFIPVTSVIYTLFKEWLKKREKRLMNLSSCKIKKIGTFNEIEQLVLIARDIWVEYYSDIISIDQIEYMLEKFQSEKAIIDQIENEEYEYYEITKDDDILGYFAIKPENTKLLISKLYIKKENRGYGFSSKAFEKIDQIAKERKIHQIYLTVNRKNTNSIELYKHKGYEIIEEADFDIGNGYYMNDYIMQKNLKY